MLNPKPVPTTELSATAPATVPLTPAAVAALEAVALLDRRLTEWDRSCRRLVPATDVVDLALDLRLLLAP
ncbi:MAG: hypothetical protein QGI28_08970 [Acidimicrobiales bacterium]|jgi:hypothetical protein|nr:hypothetical protein [Acidimicrobiales bacterium]|tara:strand:- start:89 stop:298 length:210 start_codon:yes stop_codon:yes gene_type:complete